MSHILDKDKLRAEMLEAFHSIEPHDAHVRARKEHMAAERRPEMEQSISARRAMTGATGQPETAESSKVMRALDTLVIDDPSVSDANYREWLASAKSGRTKIRVNADLYAQIGALACIKARQRHHVAAARRFRTEYEAAYGAGMAPAVDPSVTPVDTSPRAHDAGMAARVDRATSIREAIEHLGRDDADLIIAVVVLGLSMRDMGHVGKAGAHKVPELLDALDRLAEFWRHDMSRWDPADGDD